jgi:4-hydroxy-tetrahydrodipicolinate synthase
MAVKSAAPMRFNERTTGVYAIAVTPFHPDGRLDLPSVARMTEFYLRCGCSGITVLGIMGEAPKLDLPESLAVVAECVRHAAGRPIVAGVSAPGFASMRALARGAMEKGAAGVMIAPPASVRTDDQIVAYYAHAVEAIGADVPFALQDYPPAQGVIMSAGVIRRIIQDHPSCVMLKHEDWPGLEKLSLIRSFETDGSMRRVSVLIANGGLFLDFELERGADGAMTGYAFPDTLVDIIGHTASGAREKAHDLFDAHLPLIRYEQQPGIGLATRKYVLCKRGAIAHEAQRKPATPLSAVARSEIDYLLRRVSRIDPRAAV